VDEPIAYINVEERKLEWATPIKWETPTVVNLPFNIPLYIKKEWVGLTDDEVADFTLFHAVVDEECIRAIEAKLKEKNGGR
jgi:hypothetical protein